MQQIAQADPKEPSRRPAASAYASSSTPGSASAASNLAPANSQASAPGLGDLVITKSGDRYRGTIAESSPKEVQLVLPTGKVQSFAANDITYAGPVADAPSPSSPKRSPVDDVREPTNKTNSSRKTEAIEHIDSGPPLVKFEVEGDTDVTFSINTGTARVKSASWFGPQYIGTLTGYRTLCKAPCTERIAEGSYTIALSDGGTPIDAPNRIDITGPTRVRGRYNSNFGWRVTGVVVGVGSAVLGLGLIIGSHKKRDATCPSDLGSSCSLPEYYTDTAMQTAGWVIGLGGSIAGTIMYFLATDSVSVDASPMSAAIHRLKLGPLVAGETRPGTPDLARGLTLGGTF